MHRLYIHTQFIDMLLARNVVNYNDVHTYQLCAVVVERTCMVVNILWLSSLLCLVAYRIDRVYRIDHRRISCIVAMAAGWGKPFTVVSGSIGQLSSFMASSVVGDQAENWFAIDLRGHLPVTADLGHRHDGTSPAVQQCVIAQYGSVPLNH